MTPVITFATCFLLLVTWSDPGPVYAGEIPGMVWVDSEMSPLHIETAGPPAEWTAVLHPEDSVIDSGYVVVQEYPTTVWITNTPYQVSCSQVFLPWVVKEHN